jgi:DNA-binding HxlR family transcriptional regulator
VTNQEEIHQVSKALSDEFRVKIISKLIEGPPLRYSDLLHELDPENSTDSGKLAYHLNVLSGSDLVRKVNEVYQVTEMGCQVYASLKQTVEEWDTLVLRENLKSYSVWEVTFLLWSEGLNNIGIIFTVMGVVTLFQSSNIIYGLLALMGVLLLFLGRMSKPKTWEEQKDTVEHLKRLLDGNRLIPGLISTLGIFGLTILIALGTLVLTNYLTLDFLLKAVMLESLLGLFVAIWLTRRMSEVWKDFQGGKKSNDYSDALGIITSASLQFNVLVSILFFTRMLSLGEYSNIWLPLQLLIASYNLFKDSIPLTEN